MNNLENMQTQGITAEETMVSMILTKRKLAFFDKQKGEISQGTC